MRIPKKGDLVYIKNLEPVFCRYDYPYFEGFGIIGTLYKTRDTRGYFNFELTELNKINIRRGDRPHVYQKMGLTWKLVRTISFQKLKLLVRQYKERR
jgi:hypothetical protein